MNNTCAARHTIKPASIFRMLAFLYVISIGILDYTLFPEHPEFYDAVHVKNAMLTEEIAELQARIRALEERE